MAVFMLFYYKKNTVTDSNKNKIKIINKNKKEEFKIYITKCNLNIKFKQSKNSTKHKTKIQKTLILSLKQQIQQTKHLKTNNKTQKTKKKYFLDFLGGASSLLSRKSISFMRAYLYNETASLSRCNSTSNSVGIGLVSTKYSAKDNTKSPQSLKQNHKTTTLKRKGKLPIKNNNKTIKQKNKIK